MFRSGKSHLTVLSMLLAAGWVHASPGCLVGAASGACIAAAVWTFLRCWCHTCESWRTPCPPCRPPPCSSHTLVVAHFDNELRSLPADPCLPMLHVLPQARPSHTLIAADFDELPEVAVAGTNAPLVATTVGGGAPSVATSHLALSARYLCQASVHCWLVPWAAAIKCASLAVCEPAVT